MTRPRSSESSASTSANGASFAALDRRPGPGTDDNGDPAAKMPSAGESSRSSSTACRKDTPCARITQSMTLPPAWQAPRQCHTFLPGDTSKLGVWSSNGHRPSRSEPCRARATPTPSTSRATLTSAFNRAISASGTRATATSQNFPNLSVVQPFMAEYA